jgi:hypothetical protein
MMQGAHVNPRADQQGAPEQHGDTGFHQPFEEENSHPEQSNPEDCFDRLHPDPGPGQQLARRSTNRQERRAHAEAHGEEGGKAEEGIAGLPDKDEGARQWWCHAGTHDEGGKGAHDGYADQVPPLLALAEGGDPGLQAGG